MKNFDFLPVFGCISETIEEILVVTVYNIECVFSERELKFRFAICRRPSVCLSSVTFVRPTQTIEIFGNVSTL